MHPVRQYLALFLIVISVSNGAPSAGLICDVCNEINDPKCISPIKSSCNQGPLSRASLLFTNPRLGCMTVVEEGKDGSRKISKKCVLDLSPESDPCNSVKKVSYNSEPNLANINCTICHTDNCNSD